MIKPEKAKGSQLRQQKISLRFPKTGGVFGWFPLAMTVVNTCFQLDSDIQVVVSWLAIDEKWLICANVLQNRWDGSGYALSMNELIVFRDKQTHLNDNWFAERDSAKKQKNVYSWNHWNRSIGDLFLSENKGLTKLS